MRLYSIKAIVLTLVSAAIVPVAFSATPIDLEQKTPSFLQTILATKAPSAFKQTSDAVDFRHTRHIRLKQTYQGYPVMGGDVVVHIPQGTKKSLKDGVSDANTTLNGVVYQNLETDLANAPAYLFQSGQATAALKHGIELYQQKTGTIQSPQQSAASMMVYVDNNNKAHWVYLVTFTMQNAGKMPAKPSYILDATTFTVYQEWDDIQTRKKQKVMTFGGGFGGNEKVGKYVYDGLAGNFPFLDIQKNGTTCSLQNWDVIVKDYNTHQIKTFFCDKVNADHNNLYWDGEEDAVNGAYSPSNDALYVGKVIQSMYQNWYGIPPLVDKDEPMVLEMNVHMQDDNAYWDGERMVFGDGIQMFYPLVSLDIGGHEVSHGFTQQHSNLAYWGQSGGLNESFSDMAGQAVMYYATGTNNWLVGPDVMKEEGALRYMDQPSKDCGNKKPGNFCSIDNVKQYRDGLDVHFSSGVYNRFFYLLATTSGWTTRKAFDVVVEANRFYWTPYVTFATAGCNLLSATKNLGYNISAVKDALAQVGVSTIACRVK